MSECLFYHTRSRPLLCEEVIGLRGAKVKTGRVERSVTCVHNVKLPWSQARRLLGLPVATEFECPRRYARTTVGHVRSGGAT
jgi:hypothetical protein